MKRIAHGDHLIELTLFAPVFPVSAYLIREDDGFTLVDTTIRRGSEGILAAARDTGLPIRRIALTHAHGDHVGGLDALRAALPDVEVLISVRDARFLRGDNSLDPDEPRAKLRGGYVTTTTQPTRELQPGDRVGSLEVVAAPGHTPGQVAYFDLRDRTLIAGDAFQTKGGLAVSGVVRPLFPFPALATWHLPTALESARRLRALDPARLAVGHGPFLVDPLAALDEAIAVAERKVNEREPVRA
jgi:glyoxylase-like metal-dependent hydrolase (beta-lactamase superfamily II)